MNQLQQNLPHMIMGFVAIIAVTLLALEGTISGGEALAVIGGATGFTMAASATSPSAGTVQAITPTTSVPAGQTLTETMTHAVSATPANQTPGTQMSWADTWQGQSVRAAWENLMDTYNRKVPGHTDQLRTLANRPISG